jgi:hypothetical protein
MPATGPSPPVTEASPACRLRATECGSSAQREWSSNGRPLDPAAGRHPQAAVPRRHPTPADRRGAGPLARRRRCRPAGAWHPRPPTQPSLVARCRRPAPRRRRGGTAAGRGGAAARPATAVRWRRHLLGLQRQGARAWTPAEDQELGRVWRRGGELARLGRRLGRSWRPCACGPSGSAWSNRRGGAAGSPTRTAGCAPASRRGGPAPRSPPAWPAAPPGRSPLAPAGSGWPATRRWTRQEDAQLRRLAEHGTCLKRAAGILARTPQALRVRACRLGIRPPPTGPRGGGAGPRPTTSCSPVGPTSTRRGLRSCWVARRGRAPQAGGPWPAPGRRTLAPPRHRSAAAAERSPAAAAGTGVPARQRTGPGVAANRLGLPPGAVKQLAAALLTRP